MTENEWEREKKRLAAAVTRAKTKLAQDCCLADKLTRKATVKAAEAALHEHKLAFFELTCGAKPCNTQA